MGSKLLTVKDEDDEQRDEIFVHGECETDDDAVQDDAKLENGDSDQLRGSLCVRWRMRKGRV